MKSLGEGLEGPVFPQSSKNEGKIVVFFEHTNFAFMNELFRFLISDLA